MNLRELLTGVVARLQEIQTELAQADEVLARKVAEDADDETRTAHETAVKAAEETTSELLEEAEGLAEERESLENRIARRDKLAAAAKDLPKIDGAPKDAIDRSEDPYRPELAYRAHSPMARKELRDAAAKAIDQTPDWELDDDNKARLERMVRQDSHISRLVIATGSETYKNAFMKRMVGQDYLMDADEQQAVTRAMSLTDGEGGFAVPFPIDPTLIITGDGSTNPVRSVARVVNITSDSWQGVAAGATAFSFDAEAAAVSDDASTFTQPAVPVHKAQGFVPFSIEVGMDYPGLSQDLGMLFAEGKNDLEATVFITGTGTNQPTGIVTAIDGTGNDVGSATTDVFAAEDVYTVHETVGPRYRSRSTWLANIAIINDIRQFGAGASADANFTVDFTAAGIPQLMGRNILEASAMDGVIDALAENNVLVFGDFNHYVIADRAGFNLELVPHVFADAAGSRPTGQRGWYAWWRTGGDSVNDDAFALLNVT